MRSFVPQAKHSWFLVIHSTEFSAADPPTFAGRTVLIFQPPRRHFCFSCRLCLVRLWINEDAFPALSVLEEPCSSLPCTERPLRERGQLLCSCRDSLKIVLQWLCRFVPSAPVLSWLKCQGAAKDSCWVWSVKLPSIKYTLEANASKIPGVGCVCLSRRSETSVALH